MMAISRVVSLSREKGSVQGKKKKQKGPSFVFTAENTSYVPLQQSPTKSLRTSAPRVKDKLLPVLTWPSGNFISLPHSGRLKTERAGYCKATELLHVVSVFNRRKRNTYARYGLLQ
jgi:hypothetical protein